MENVLLSTGLLCLSGHEACSISEDECKAIKHWAWSPSLDVIVPDWPKAINKGEWQYTELGEASSEVLQGSVLGLV